MKNWSIADESCLICGSKKIISFKAKAFDAGKKDRVNIRECLFCTFAWQFPRGRNRGESAEWYEIAYQQKSENDSKYFDEENKRKISQLELNFIASLEHAGQELLDIGAGAGIFAEVAAENNWNVTAVDPALNENRFNNNPKVNAIKGSFDDLPKNSQFDVITMWDVIEYVDDPLILIDQAKKLLKKGGWLIVETGNYKSVDRVMGGASHWMYQLDHRWYFSPDSIQAMLAESGFDHTTVANEVLRPGWQGALDYEGSSKLFLLKAIIKKPFNIKEEFSKYRSLRKAVSWKHSGISIFVTAAKCL